MLFQVHYTLHAYIWTSPNGEHKNQIDYGTSFVIKVGTLLNDQLIWNMELTEAQITNFLQSIVGSNWKKDSKRMSSSKYDLNNILDKYTADIRERFSVLDLMEYQMSCGKQNYNTVQDTAVKYIPIINKARKAKWLSAEALQIVNKKCQVKCNGDRLRVVQLNIEFQRLAGKDKNGFMNQQYK